MTTLDEAYLDGLVTYLNAQYTADPPLQGAFGLIRFGKLQEDPTAYAAVALLKYGDRDDSTWAHEMVQAQGDVAGTGGNWGSGLWGRFLELGGGSHWWHRYTCELIRYLINTTQTRADSMAQGIELAWWLAKKINQATPTVLNLTTTGGQDLLQSQVTRVRPREAGGPDNYIWKVTIQFQALVHHAN